MLNPGEFKLPKPPSYSNDKFTYYGYFIAGGVEETQAITIFQETQNIYQADDES